ncbi:hypothetical protein QTO34_012381 [Cnephaeus nilssonii]|uniref:LIM/homeobox protein Lhx9 n=1 Tax=Cnephaeus nilssonii TaxID=3371016 RepID=A0AA40LDC5_CNENI|nr:hypothetical protein QTO34_012381 [Eptesicus nilssonii]
MEIVGCRAAEDKACPFRPPAMLFHGISGGHIQGIMEEMERRSKSEARLAKGAQLNGRDAGRERRCPRCALCAVRCARWLPRALGPAFRAGPSPRCARLAGPAPAEPEKPALCAGCGGKISDRYYLLAVDKQWHLRCLKCCECKLALESELTCFAKDGSIYCKEDYYSSFLPPPRPDRDGDGECARGSRSARSPASDAVGTEAALDPTGRFHVHCNRMAFPFVARCPAWGDGPALASTLTRAAPFPSRRFSVQRCARCHLGISASEMVMRARDAVYHLSCFTCSTCSKTLTTGDHFGMKDSLVYCRAHFEALLQGEYPAPLSYTELAAKGGGLALPYFNGTGTCPRAGPASARARRWEWTSSITAQGPALSTCRPPVPTTGCNENEADHLDRDQQPYPPSQKTKRMRTSFKHHQLRTMKSYFAINHNPDAKDLKQLAQKTGLTKRVLQVWFQNARAKFRRNLLRQENGGVDKAEGPSLPAPPPADSGALTPPGPAAALTDLATPTLPVGTAVTSNMDSQEPASPPQTTLTSLF